MKIVSHDDISNLHREVEGYDKCHEFVFDEPVPDFENEQGSPDEEKYDDLAIKELELYLGYRFDEDDWYTFDWRDDVTLWVRFNEPYFSRRLSL